MSVEGVMVSYNHSGPEENANIITVSASGIKFSNRWVLTHGSILSPLKIAKDVHNSKGKPILNERFYENLPEMYITCELSKSDSEVSLQQHYDTLAHISRLRNEPDGQDMDNSSYQVRVLTGRICHLWQCPVLDRCVDDILYSWTIGHRDADIDQQLDLGKTLLSVFVLIDLDSEFRDTKPLRPLSELLDAVRLPPDRGSRLQVHSTPFGCEVFLNCVTSGTVCGVVGARPSLLLTDASTALGSEGAPVYTHPDDGAGSGLIGMVVCSVSWWRGEWVGLTLVAPLTAVLNTKLRIVPPPNKPTIVSNPELQETLKCIDSTTVLVRCGASWGTGVYIGHGYVLTCAHVVKRHSLEKLSVYCLGVRATAILRYKTRDDNAYDLALLFTNPDTWPHLKEARFAKSAAVKGEPVVAVGYPYFNEKNVKDLKPTITSGHVNNVSPSMIQTSCCVQSGFSGGAIYRLRQENGGISCEVVGIIVSNAKTQQTNACYPYINMAIPSQVFENLLTEYLDDKSEEKLRVLASKKEMIQSQWRLLPYRSKI